MAMRRSESLSRPKSPCMASIGCMTAAGLPVLLKVAQFYWRCASFSYPGDYNFPLRLIVSSRAWMAMLKVPSSCWLIAQQYRFFRFNVFLAWG